ncbi:uncharacterized protein BJ171DRAFT_525958 [Polychytrium aggregatum]|uniref:uncharacterized protein n=1 Tax=Polychytrium aggregatum TaxID=110093 RepID=UPI0022FDECE3|nr:uncharacterized protein BJ171DRAFT_525958 [Polychytrium aggregatum]KAI9193519.1 hypothetical protein BJ171DRAFT_525958 [Polychytrium aggregatum]
MMEVPIDDTVTQQIGKQVDAVGNKAFSSGIGAGAKVHKVAHNTGHSVADKLAIGAAVATVVAASVFNGVVTTAISTSRAATFAAGGSTDACAFIQSSGDMSISSACCGAVVNYQSQWQDCYNSVSNWESLVPDNDLTISNCVQQAENTWVSLSDATLQQTAYFDGQVLKCIGPYVSSECSTLGQLLVSNCA